MFPTILFPLIASFVVAVVATTAHRRMPPALASKFLATSLAVVAIAAVPTVLLVGIGFVGHLPVVGDLFDWCQHAIGIHALIPWWIGVPAVAVGAIGLVRTIRVLRAHRRLRHDRPGPIEIADHDGVFALTLPGRAGHVVISRGLIDLLDEREQSVVYAHERAHGRHRHDRYLLIGHVAQAGLPMLRPLLARLEFSLERWADEAAVDAHGGDRHFVARTLGKVVLNSPVPVGALGFAGLGVAARFTALLDEPVARPSRATLGALWAAIVVAGLFSGYQLHHLAWLVDVICPG